MNIKKINGFLALTRWKEIYDYTLVTTLIAAVMANIPFSPMIFLIYLNNFIGQLFPYALNDVEDAEDDARDPKKAKRNPVSNKTITKKEGYIFSAILFSLSLLITVLIAFINKQYILILVTLFTLMVMFFYNWIPVRFKSMRILDILSHAYMLGGACFLFTYLAYNQSITPIGWLGIIAVTLLSGWGQMENQIRDFTVDQLCKIKNTTDLIGLKAARMLGKALFFSGIALFGYYLATLPNLNKVLPWVGGILTVVLSIPIIRYIFSKNQTRLIQELKRCAMFGSYTFLILMLLQLI